MKLTSGSGDFMVKELKATKLILQSTAGNKEFRDVYIKETST